MVCNFGHQLFYTDIKQFWLAHGYVAVTSDRLKAYRVAQVYIFLSGWLQEASVKCYYLMVMNRHCIDTI
jgi:hypothetical protein